MKMRRITAIVLAAILMLLGMAIPAAAAEEYTAASMTLEDTEGTFTIRNAKDKEVSLRKGARLYKGYSAETEDGYLWIGLDDAKAIKLDQDTEVTLKKSGDKMEILLVSGKLFFNVTKPLDEEESLIVRTTNMSTSIRGTSGIVETSKEPSTGEAKEGVPGMVCMTTVTILDGRVEVLSAAEDGSNETERSIVEAGWQGVIRSEGGAEGTSEQTTVDLNPIAVGDVLLDAPFAAVEAAADEDLLSRIRETSENQAAQGITGGATLEDVTDRAETLLEESEEDASTARKSNAKEVEDARREHMNQRRTAVEQVFPFEDNSGYSAPQTHTVRFFFQNTLFAEQTVTHNAYIESPLLMPTSNGTWRIENTQEAYRFRETPVVADLTLTWAEGN